jgi:hypothetical protein
MMFGTEISRLDAKPFNIFNCILGGSPVQSLAHMSQPFCGAQFSGLGHPSHL